MTGSMAKIQHSVTYESIIADLRRLGIVEGDHIAVGISLKSIGIIDGGPDSLVRALLNAVGEKGTLLIPSYTSCYSLSDYKLGNSGVFDVKQTRANTGAVAEIMRAHSKAIRSRHPTNSVVAIGAQADFITRSHDECSSSYLPFSRLADINGKFLALGIGDRLVGLRHEAQYLAGLLDIVPQKLGTLYRDRNGSEKWFHRSDAGGCVERLAELVTDLRDLGLVKDGSLGAAGAVLVPIRESLKIMTDILRENPTRTLCGGIGCLWCRELERRMDLRKSVENRVFFQRHATVYKVIDGYNWFRLQDFLFYAYLKRCVRLMIKRKK